MIKLNVDLELLVQSLFFENDDLCKEYLDKITGEIINIPSDVQKVVDGSFDEAKLPDWEKDFLEEAYAIENDEQNRYLFIPQIKASHSFTIMEKFAEEKITDPLLKSTLLEALNKKNSMREFKNILVDYPDVLDNYYDYEEEKSEDLALNWLKENGIEVLI